MDGRNPPRRCFQPTPFFSHACAYFHLKASLTLLCWPAGSGQKGVGWGRQRKGQVTGPWPVSLEVIEVREVEEAAWVNCDLSGGLSQNPIPPPGTPPCRDTDVATSHSKQTLLVRVALGIWWALSWRQAFRKAETAASPAGAATCFSVWCVQGNTMFALISVWHREHESEHSKMIGQWLTVAQGDGWLTHTGLL